MSRILWPKVLPRVRVCGRFFELEPKTKRLQSLRSEKNSRLAGSEKGLMAFFFTKRLANGWRSA